MPIAGVWQLSKILILKLIDPKLPAALLICRKRKVHQIKLGHTVSLADAGSSLCAPNYCRRYRSAARHPQPIDTPMS
jgi:hypothetical protein